MGSLRVSGRRGGLLRFSQELESGSQCPLFLLRLPVLSSQSWVTLRGGFSALSEVSPSEQKGVST